MINYTTLLHIFICTTQNPPFEGGFCAYSNTQSSLLKLHYLKCNPHHNRIYFSITISVNYILEI